MRYQIVCTRQEPARQPNDKAHIVAAGTGSQTGYTKLWSLDQILSAMRQGDSFFTRGESSGREATVNSYVCNVCGGLHIRSGPDAVLDNNLDSLSRCN